MKSNRRVSFNDAGHVHFLTFSCFRRSQILLDENACILLAELINRARKRHEFDLWAYVFMPDHVHLLIRPRTEDYSISTILRSIKGTFARKYIDEWKRVYPGRLTRLEVRSPSGSTYRVWQRGGGYDRNLLTPDVIQRAIEYIELNPVRRGFVADALEWKWSSAMARAGYADIPLQMDEISEIKKSLAERSA